MATQFFYDVMISVKCKIQGCGNTHTEQKMTVIPGGGSNNWSPDLPAGWRVLDGYPICPQHTISVLVALPACMDCRHTEDHHMREDDNAYCLGGGVLMVAHPTTYAARTELGCSCRTYSPPPPVTSGGL